MHWAFTFISFYTISIVPIAAFPIILERGPIYLKKGIVLYFQNNQAPEQFLASNYTQDVKAISVYLSDPKTDPSARLRFITIADTDLSIGKTSIALVQPQSDDPEKFVDSLNVNRYNGRLDVYPTPLSGQVQADSWYIHGPGSMGSDAAPFGFAYCTNQTRQGSKAVLPMFAKFSSSVSSECPKVDFNFVIAHS